MARTCSLQTGTGERKGASSSAQSEAEQGPCLDTLHESKTVLVADMAAEARWPQFAERAAELGVGSVLSVQLYVDGNDLGALNLLSERTEAFDDESEQVAPIFASHAAVAMAGAQEQGTCGRRSRP